MRVGYLTFGRDQLGYGMRLCLDRWGGESFRVTPKTARYADAILFSLFWWEHLYLLADWLRKAGLPKSRQQRPRTIAGGFNTFNPVPIGELVDQVVVGDGEGVLPSALNGEAHPSIYESGGTAAWANEPLDPIAHVTNGITRIELCRGCRFRCQFCAVTHLKPFREAPVERVESLLKACKTKRVSLFAPEPTLHAHNETVSKLCEQLGIHREDSDVRLERIGRAELRGAVPRVGIEGLSERLRKSINKPCPDAKIIESVKTLIAQGGNCLFMYLILDLPGEQPADWEAFGELLRKIDEIPGIENFVLKPSPNVFVPNPHTPLEMAPIHWDRPYRSMWQKLFGTWGTGRKWKVKMAERTRVFGPSSRILSLLSMRGGTDFPAIEDELTRRKIIAISGGRVTCRSLRGLLKVLDRYGGVDRFCGVPKDRPWAAVTVA